MTIIIQRVKSCSVSDCPTPVPVLAKGLCKTHYHRLRDTGSLELSPAEKSVRLCSVDGCERKHNANGLCQYHTDQLRRHGTLDPAPRTPVPKAICSFEDEDGRCEKFVHSNGLCQNHYRKARRPPSGFSKPGPKPDPSKPNSRHNPQSTHHAVVERVAPPIKVRLAVGMVCANGHFIETDNHLKHDVDGKTQCKLCAKNKRLEKVGKPPVDELIDDRSLAEKKTHCKRGHEYVEGSYYERLDKDGYLNRQCKECGRIQGWKSRYGITPEQYDEMMRLQESSCAHCNHQFDDDHKPHVDHDHEAGHVRGILCNKCNTGLGMLGDSIAAIEHVLQYLRRQLPSQTARQ